MSSIKAGITKERWHQLTDASNALSIEADRLDELAYQLINQTPFTARELREFSIAKKAANEKHEEARLSWDAARREVDKIKLAI